ncbi:hypothetical protein FGO68_gene10079 [Halteria grandinella]|uniref:Gamma-butyrobetaine hydroxylase-like N-terminal domain-containing protein n=1 Tax=Halteria grandinella TaxID=5974 RepID=A0A8J8NRL1_HALGN|nr:hypothetical protein FGO68_gene10079 [Halteria grandinella]
MQNTRFFKLQTTQAPLLRFTQQRSFSGSPADDEVLRALDEIKDEKGKTLQELGMLHSLNVKPSEGLIAIKLNLTTDYRKVKTLIQNKLQERIHWAQKLEIGMAPAPQQAKGTHALKKGLQKVKNIIAVSSCKGGVGKSTVAVNLAYSIATLYQDYSVGIFDADLYGPSLPTMINPVNTQLFQDENDPSMIAPIEFNGVKAMSYGFAAQNSANGKAAIMRGPIASNLVTQLIGNTNWGELDFLIVDFPPGTGDIQLTLGQEVALKAAVIVTTPQKLAYVDVIKGIEMFDQLKVPTIAVIENMSYYKCGTCDTKHKIFGQGYTNQIKNDFGIKSSFEVPILEDIASMSDSGTPFVLTLPETTELVQVYHTIAHKVLHEVSLLDKRLPRPEVSFDPKSGLIVLNQNGQVIKKVNPYELRLACRCAGCIDEFDGRKILKTENVPKDVHPTNIHTKGNYAVAMVWSDGHKSSIYPFERILGSEIKDQK